MHFGTQFSVSTVTFQARGSERSRAVGQSCKRKVEPKKSGWKRKIEGERGASNVEGKQQSAEGAADKTGGTEEGGWKERWVVVFHQIVLLQACGRQLLLHDFFLRLVGCGVQIVREGWWCAWCVNRWAWALFISPSGVALSRGRGESGRLGSQLARPSF